MEYATFLRHSDHAFVQGQGWYTLSLSRTTHIISITHRQVGALQSDSKSYSSCTRDSWRS